MRKTVLLIFLLMMPMVFADVRIDEIKGYINNERAPDINDDGGKYIINPRDIIDLIVKMENTYNVSVEVRLKATLENIDDGDDVVKEQDWYTINEEDDRSKGLSFSIPSDANIDNYDLELEINYKWNGSEYDIHRDFEVIVEAPEIEEEIDINEVIANLTASCNDLAETTNICFGYVGRFDNCSGELSTVKEERGRFEQKFEDCDGTLSNVRNEVAEANREKESLDNQMKQMITKVECNNNTAIAVRIARSESDSKHNRTLMIMAVGGFAFWYFQKKKKEKGSVESAYYAEKG